MTQDHIHHVFNQRYNQTNWKQFLGEAFAHARLLATPETLTGIDPHVASQVQKLGYITLNENGIERQIAVYEVTLAQGIILERNRVGLRNLLRKYWKDIDAAFVTYHHTDKGNWRFTYVSELTGYDAEGEFIKIITEPKRYTYVLGEGESTRTAAERFTTIANKGSKATLEDVKEAFSVEKLSKAFFDEYKKHYDIFCKYMVDAPNIRQTLFNGDEKAIRDFNKKLLGRIVFLYFIQKKGWLGVPATDDWGKGDFNFLTQQFEHFGNKDLFYQQFLSPLFFETLNQKRENDIAPFLNQQDNPSRPEKQNTEDLKIPYLNGGLFEEDDKKHRSIIFPAHLFKSLFDFFNQYNFTIYEDDPNDHTVAVDPEMLGHIFENLLEDNKDKGAFYTPKEIVHYMCQESLIEYLTTWFQNKGYHIVGHIGLDKPHQPQLFSPNEGRKGQLVLETDAFATSSADTNGNEIDRTLIEKLLKKKLDHEDTLLIKKHAAEFHNALDRVKICDPAIGSGAFPMGLLHEIFTAKQTLHTFEHGNTKTFDASGVKLNIIQNSIYGVDIEKGAVDIARLRFWLSLIVDEEKPKTLPNLDYKIVVGNSLVSKLGDVIIDIDWTLNETAHGLFGADLAKQKGDLLKKISQEQKEFFNPESEKKKLASDIRNLKIDLLINQLELMVTTQGIETTPTGTGKTTTKQTEIYLQTLGWKDTIKQLKKLKNKPDAPLHFFDWKLDFPEVMNEQVTDKAGFDIVIGNPPYFEISESSLKNRFQVQFKEVLSGHYDVYLFFFKVSFDLISDKGIVSFITPHTFLHYTQFSALRKYIYDNTRIVEITDRLPNIFENAIVDTSISILTKSINDKNTKFSIKEIDNGNVIDKDFLLINKTDFTDSTFDITAIRKLNELNKYSSNTLPLGDIVDSSQGITVYAKVQGEKINYFRENNREKNSKKFLKGRDFNKYQNNWTNGYIIYGKHLWCRRDSKYFEEPKIFVRQTSDCIIATYIEEPFYAIDSVHSLISKNESFDLKYILSILNSRLGDYLFHLLINEDGKVFAQVKLTFLRRIPIKTTNSKIQSIFIKRVDKILSLKSQSKDTTTLEQEIDNLVYKLYELTYDEVKLVDPEFGLSKKEYEALQLK